MKGKAIRSLMMVLIAALLILPGNTALAEKPIIIGSPLSTSYLYGWDAERAIKLAISEINGAGGVNVGGTNRHPGPGTRSARQRSSSGSGKIDFR